jgi:hypothetical protein
MLRPMTGREIVICTSAQRISLGNDAAMSLLEHIRRDAGEHRAQTEGPLLAAINQGGYAEVKWSDEGKAGALRAIGAWLDAEGAFDIAEPLMDLRYELMRDLKIPPFTAG